MSQNFTNNGHVYVPIRPASSLYADNLAYWENFLSDAQLSYLNQLADQAKDYGDIGVANLDAKLDKNTRSSFISWMHPAPENQSIWQSVTQVIGTVNASFFGYDLTGFYEPAQLTRYTAEIQGHYTWHMDCNPKIQFPPRKLSAAILLNDPSEFEGGDFYVRLDNNDPDPVEQKKGRMWVFPSWAFHRVAPVTAGVRKTLVLWAGGPAFR